jgi:acyl dehydratase
MMPATDSRTPLYFEDLEVGQKYATGTHTVVAADIVRFAREFDPQPFHVDESAGNNSVFGGLVASGWHTAGITMRLLVEGGAKIAGGMIGGGGDIKWTKPVRPGDTLHVVAEIIELTRSESRADRGIVTMRIETRNQHAETVQILICKIIVPRR